MKKKLILCFVILLAILCLSYYAYDYYTTNKKVTPDKPEEKPIEEVDKGIYPTTFNEIKESIDSGNKMFMIVGKTGCAFCEQYKPLINKLANKYNFQYTYVNIAELSEEDYRSFMMLDMIIPGKCGASGEDFKLQNGFGTPLSLFIENGQVYDCIRGYKKEEVLPGLLKDAGYIQ